MPAPLPPSSQAGGASLRRFFVDRKAAAVPVLATLRGNADLSL
jgi:hypothetical protein